MTAGRRWALLAAAAVLIGAAGGMVRSSYVLGMLIFIALNGMAALGLSLVMGFAGRSRSARPPSTPSARTSRAC